jgi:type I restriction enzyme, S subunit
MSELPKGWVEIMLEQLCSFNPRHNALTDRQTKISFVPMPAVCDREGIILPHETRFLEEVWKGYTHFQDNDVIFTKITPCMENGKISLATRLHNGLACGSTEFHVLRPSGAVLSEYLWRFLRQVDFRKEAERSMTGAVGQRRVPVQFLKEANLPLPPLPEQHRIVAKLDSLFTRSRRAREALERVPGLCERYKQAVLAAACSGRLTADWRERNPDVETASELLKQIQNTRLTMGWTVQKTIDSSKIENIQKEILHELPSSWSWSNLSEFKGEEQLVLTGPFGTSLGKEDFLTNGVAVITIGCLTDTGLSKDKAVFMGACHILRRKIKLE